MPAAADVARHTLTPSPRARPAKNAPRRVGQVWCVLLFRSTEGVIVNRGLIGTIIGVLVVIILVIIILQLT